MGFVLGVALTGAGGWLLYRNFIYGDVVSVTIALLSFMMIGSGTLMLPTASASRGPTVMVLVVGVIASTKRGSPSGAGVPSRRPRRCPIVNR